MDTQEAQLESLQAELDSIKSKLLFYKVKEDEHFKAKQKAYLESQEFGVIFRDRIANTLALKAKEVVQ